MIHNLWSTLTTYVRTYNISLGNSSLCSIMGHNITNKRRPIFTSGMVIGNVHCSKGSRQHCTTEVFWSAMQYAMITNHWMHAQEDGRDIDTRK